MARRPWTVAAAALLLSFLLACFGATEEPEKPKKPKKGAPASDFIEPPPALIPAKEAADAEVRLLPRPGEAPLSIAALKTEPLSDGAGPEEAEPNDTLADANPLDDAFSAHGSLEGKDVDVYELIVEDEPGLWTLEVKGKTVDNSRLFRPAGTLVQLRAAPGDRQAAHGVYLTPGRYGFEVKGKRGGDYTVRATRIGAPDPRTEREPNDVPTGAHGMQLGETRTGWLAPKNDEDYYRFSLPAGAHVRVSWKLDTKTNVFLKDATFGAKVFSREVTGPGHFDGWLEQGDYTFSVKGREASDTPYEVRYDLLDPFVLPDDLEPNDELDTARDMPVSLSVQGEIGVLDQEDIYRLPVQDRDARFEVTWTGTADSQNRARVAVRVEETRSGVSSYDNAKKSWTGTIPAGQLAHLRFRKPGPYAASIAIEGVVPVSHPPAPDVQLSGPTEALQVAAYREVGQTLEIPVVLEGSGDVQLESWISTHGWRVVNDAKTTVSGRTELPVRIEIPADADASAPVYIVLAARSGPAGPANSTTILVQPVCGAPLVGPRMHWSLPDALLGGVNVARRDLGASIEPDTERWLHPLIDGVTGNDAGTHFKQQFEAVVKLAVEAEIAGFVIDTMGRAGNRRDRPFTLQLSTDGTSWDTVYDGRFERAHGEQAFVLDTPRKAAYARLVVPEKRTAIGELKIIATPGSKPLGSDPLVVSEPRFGGRFARTRPHISSAERMLGEGKKDQRYRITPGEPLDLVVAFEHHRRAKVGALEWVQPKENYDVRTKVSVAVSETSPVGPWTAVASWDLPGPNETGTLELETPVWARYLKLTNLEDEGRFGMLPNQIRVFEAADAERSVIGEYGKYARVGPYEVEHGLAARADVRGERGENDTIETATPLALDTPVADQVSVGEDVDVYRIAIPSGHNRLVVEGRGEPSLNAVLTFRDADGTELVARSERGPDATVFTVDVTEGDVFVEVAEPPRSVALLWDQSGSVSAFIPQIYSAVTEFVEVVEPGKEVANLYPFQDKFPGKFLADDWLDSPAELQQVLNGYDRRDKSSSAELALLSAVREMEEREGTKGILILTDAETHSNDKTPELWDRFSEVRPRVFTMELHIGNVPWHQDLMQGWADIDAGHYSYFADATALDIAFDRASCHLRRPQSYELLATTEFTEPPKPGTIEVEPAGLQGYAVEVILDASGSMLKRMSGRSRIDIAKTVLSDLVGTTIPPETPLAMRVFGHRKAGSCQTDLEVPLAPLDREAVSKKIASIGAKNLAKTPIGDSLLAVQTDLASHEGPKLVVLLTDGEETCDGDPAAAIAALQEAGLDVRMNIVGFAIDDARLKSDFEAWAKSGGGVYHDANSEEELGSAMLDALSPKLQVLNAAGDVVVEGTVGGEPVSVEVGTYTVKVLTSPVKTFEVEVGSGQAVKLSLAETP